MSPLRIAITGTILLSALLSGCANQIASVEEQQEIPSNTLVKQTYAVEGSGAIIANPQVDLTLQSVETYDKSVEYVTIRTEEFTPYAGWRELYEVPVGVVAFPAAIVFKGLDILTFGLIPNEQTNGFLTWSAASVNPFMNTQSPSRSITLVNEEVTGQTEVITKLVRTPIADAPIHVRVNDTPSEELETDTGAKLSFHLLDILPGRLEHTPRKLILTGVPGSEAAELRSEFFLDRALAQQLVEASHHLVRFDATRYSIEYLANAIYALDQLGFKAYSIELEDRVIAQRGYDEEDIDKLRTKLATLYGPAPAGN